MGSRQVSCNLNVYTNKGKYQDLKTMRILAHYDNVFNINFPSEIFN